MEDDFDAPPTPSRFGHVASCAKFSAGEFVESSSSIEMVDDKSLTLLTGEVAEAQKHQISELSEKENRLQLVKNEYEKIHDEYTKNEEELRYTNRQLYLMQDNAAEIRRKCATLQASITQLLTKKLEMRKNISCLYWNEKEKHLMYDKYKEKMQNIDDVIRHYFQELPLSKKVEKLQKEVEEKKTEYKDLQNAVQSEDHNELTRNVGCLERQKDDFKKENESLNSQIQSEKERVTMLKNEIEAIHKRKAAHLSRLKRQIDDTKNRIEQWKGNMVGLGLHES